MTDEIRVYTHFGFTAIQSSLGRHYARGYDATGFVRYFLGAIAGAAENVLSRIKSHHRAVACAPPLGGDR